MANTATTLRFTTQNGFAPEYAPGARTDAHWRMATHNRNTYVLTAEGDGTGGWGANRSRPAGYALYVNGRQVNRQQMRGQFRYANAGYFATLAEARRAAEMMASE